jgi:hypothetical protein
MPRSPDNSFYSYLDALRPPAVSAPVGDLEERLKLIEAQLSALAAQHQWHVVHRRPWLSFVLMKGISPSTENFVQNERQLSSFRAAGYQRVSDIAEQQPESGKHPAEVIYERCLDAYAADRANVAPPPDPEEVRMFYEICRRQKDQQGASS